MGSNRLRLLAGILAFVMLAAACSSTPEPDDDLVIGDVDVDRGDTSRDADSEDASDEEDDGDEDEVAEGAEESDSEPATDESGDARASGSSEGSEGSSSGSGNGESGSISGNGASDGGDSEDPGPPSANVYSADQAVVGITDDEIYLCGHAALIFAEAFQIRAEDLNVYFEQVNDNGGVHGRSVRIDWEDDAYNPNQAVTAAQTCVNRDPFMLIGGIGFDQIPGVRTNVENNWKLPYIHHIAVEPESNPTYSFGFLPSVEKMGVGFGEYIAERHGDKKVGIISRSSENWSPGHATAVATLEANGVDIVGDFKANKDQHVYQQELFRLQQAGAEVVWVWESALAAAEVLQQARAQNYHPTWVVFPFQLTLDAAAPASPVEGVAAWPSYAPGGYGGDSPLGHDQDIAQFEQAYAEYRPNTDPNDLLYIAWVAHKAMHQLLLDCGPDCDRNKIHGLLESGYTRGGSDDASWNPNCPVDFGRSDSFGNHYGGFSFYGQHVIDHSGFGPAFETTDYCWDHFG